MAEQHDAILRNFRKRLLNQGYKEAKSPMPTYKPDIFCQKLSRYGKILKEIVVEAEIESTLSSEHTSSQLVIMGDYITQRRKRKINIYGYLLIPKGKDILCLAKLIISSLFPNNNLIKIKQLPV